VRLLQEARHRIARLRALGDPILRAVHLDAEIIALLQRLIGSNLLDELAIARTAAIGHDNAENRQILRADPLHANFN